MENKNKNNDKTAAKTFGLLSALAIIGAVIRHNKESLCGI